VNVKTVNAEGLLSLLSYLWKHLQPSRKQELKVLFCITILTSLAEIFSIEMVLPFHCAMMHPDVIDIGNY
jgi:hypothetical protein